MDAAGSFILGPILIDSDDGFIPIFYPFCGWAEEQSMRWNRHTLLTIYN
jgi:hypothetical protein